MAEITGYASIASPFARKVRVAEIETGQGGLIDWRWVGGDERAVVLADINPLGKVPSVVLGDGTALFDSPVIAAYVDARHDGPKLIPDAEPERWAVLTLEALGDGLAEAVVAVAQEGAKALDKQTPRVLERQGGKVARAPAVLDSKAAGFSDPPCMGEISVACAMGYMEYRGVAAGWRATHSALAAWYDAIEARPSFAATPPDAKA